MTTTKMKVEIWSDLTCPFCYTAKRQLEKALSQFKHAAGVHLVWKSFELAPGLKTDPGKNLPQFLAELKGVSLEEAKGMTGYVTNSAREVGLTYHLDKAIPANSFNAHRLSHLAKHYQLQDKAEERLFKAYFTEGKNIDDLPTLIQLAHEIGIDADEAKNMLEGTKYVAEVQQDIYEAQQAGVTSVPFFVFNGKSVVPGAQGSQVFLETLERTFAQWLSGDAQTKPGMIDGQSCKTGEDCK